MTTENITYQVGLPVEYINDAIELYEQAFGQKFAVAISSKEQRIQLFKKTFNLDYVIGAIDNNKLVGIAGFQTTQGSLTDGITYRSLISQFGLIMGNWAALILGLYERKVDFKQLVMDGIAVHSEARGKGIGSQLLTKVAQHAKEHDFNTVRLDVIDTNPRAKALYERMGFKSTNTEYYPYLKWLLGFSGSTTMELTVS